MQGACLVPVTAVLSIGNTGRFVDNDHRSPDENSPARVTKNTLTQEKTRTIRGTTDLSAVDRLGGDGEYGTVSDR